MQQVTSPDISLLDFSVLFDISGANPVVTINNLSTVITPTNLKWSVSLYSPSTSVKIGSLSLPDFNHVAWNTPVVINSGFPKPFNALEWSGSPFRVVVQVQDSENKIFTEEKKIRVQCPPGWDKNTKTMFGKGKIGVMAQCHIGKVFIKDETPVLYQGFEETIVSKQLKVVHPANDGGESHTDDVGNFSSVLLKVFVSGPGYNYFYVKVSDFEVDDNVVIRLKFIDRDTFAMNCNLDLAPIACDLEKLLQTIQNGDCQDIKAAEKKAQQVGILLHIATLGIAYPMSGIDPFKQVDKIKDITGWACDCCSSSITPFAQLADSNSITAYDVISEGGDITGLVEIVGGTTVLIKLKDTTYKIKMCDSNMSTAFEFDESIVGQTKTYCLKVDRNKLAEEMLADFASNSTFINALNQLIIFNLSNGKVNVDPKCLKIAGAASNTYTYGWITPRSFELGETFLIKGIKHDKNPGSAGSSLNFLFDGGNLVELKEALDSLELGVWTVTYPGNVLTLTVTSEYTITEILGHFSTELANVDTVMIITKHTSPVSSYNISDVFQALINFVCSEITTNLRVGIPLSVSFLQAIGGAITSITIGSGDLMTSFFDKFVGAYNNLVNLVKGIGQPSCETTKSIFQTANNVPLEDTDKFLANINGSCKTVSPQDIAVKIFDMAIKNVTVKDLMCKAVSACVKPVCGPVTAAVATYNAGTGDLTVVITNTGAVQYRVQYRLVSIGRPSIIGQQIINATVGATTTHTWAGVVAGTWEVISEAICADGSMSSPFSAVTASCAPPTTFNVVINGSNFEASFSGLPVNADKFRIEILYPNGGTFAANYATAIAQPIVIPIPGGVYGDFRFSARTSCSEAAGWYSEPTSVITLNVPSPATCPLVTKVEFSAITDTTATVVATKPPTIGGGTTPQAFILQLTPLSGGAAIRYMANPAGPTVTWNLTGLTPSTLYAVEVFTVCRTGESDPFNAGSLITSPAGATNSHVTNNTANEASAVSVMIDNAIVHAIAPLAAAAASAFNVNNYTGAIVKVTACDAGATAATLTSGANVYNHSAIDGETFIFTNVTIVGNDVEIEFS